MLLTLCACSRTVTDTPTVAPAAEPVIYGDDDRVEPERLAQLSWAPAATARAVALVVETSLARSEDEGDDAGVAATATPPSAKKRLQLCPEERFAAQPSLADCSGVLVSSDLVLTAGHCFTEHDECDRYRYALRYVHESDDADAGTIDPAFVRCREMVIREVGQLSDGIPIDYALVRLERPVLPMSWEPASPEQAVEPEARVTAVGFPMGLPLKFDANGRVLAVDRTGFQLTTDAYHGSSGSGLYDSLGRLVGILTSGEADFEWDPARSCQRSRVITLAEAGAAERGMHAWLALSRACLRAPDPALCPSALDAGPRDGGAPAGRDAAVAGSEAAEGWPKTVVLDAAANDRVSLRDRDAEATMSVEAASNGARRRPRATGCSSAPNRSSPRSSVFFSLVVALWIAIRAGGRRW